MDDNDVFDSVTWDQEGTQRLEIPNEPSTSAAGGAGYRVSDSGGDPSEVKWEGYLVALVSDPIKELEGTKDMYVSYRVAAKVSGLELDTSMISC